MVRHAAVVFSQWFLMNWSSTLYGLGLAVVGAILIELFGITRGIGAFQGLIRDKFAERSVASLRKRIAQMEEYRAELESYGKSELFLVLALFKFVLAILTMMCAAAAFVLLVRFLPPLPPVVPLPSPILSLVILFGFLFAALVGIYGMGVADLNSPSKIAARIVPIDAKISKLKVKLSSRIS
jgi:hypothetical protein